MKTYLLLATAIIALGAWSFIDGIDKATESEELATMIANGSHPFVRQSIVLTSNDICHVLEVEGMRYLYCRNGSGGCALTVMPGNGYYDLLREEAEGE